MDVVSEPSSPTDDCTQLLQIALLESEPKGAPDSPVTSPAQEMPEYLKFDLQASQDNKPDLPIVLTSSDTICEEKIIDGSCIPIVSCEAEATLDFDGEETYFEAAFTAVLEERQSRADNLAQQERLDPSDSISRLHVPILDFNISQPEWLIECSSSRQHFSWLRESKRDLFAVPLAALHTQSARELKWMPYPRGRAVVDMGEKLEQLGPPSRRLLMTDATEELSRSSDYIQLKSNLAILHLVGDEEIESMEVELETDANSLMEIEPQLEAAKSTDSIKIHQLDSTKDNDWSSFLPSLRRKATAAPTGALPKAYDTSATSSLLSSFMELRAIKRPRIAKSNQSDSKQIIKINPTLKRRTDMSISQHQPAVREPHQIMVPALAPEAVIPAEKGVYMFSLYLSREILHFLETAWSSENLIDKDYSLQNTLAWSPGKAQHETGSSTLAFEADISLTPAVGIIITSILKVKQRSLPGSKKLTPLRERVRKVGMKYETLIVLVSESNPDGEFTGHLVHSDAMAFTDFVHFSVIESEVGASVSWVPGSDGTMAKWILSLMCRYSSQSFALGRFPTTSETTWEVFLRRAGMNILAAQIISKTLYEQAGASGLTAFLVMPLSERISKYAKLLGGERVLRASSAVLDLNWNKNGMTSKAPDKAINLQYLANREGKTIYKKNS